MKSDDKAFAIAIVAFFALIGTAIVSRAVATAVVAKTAINSGKEVD